MMISKQSNRMTNTPLFLAGSWLVKGIEIPSTTLRGQEVQNVTGGIESSSH